MTLTSRSLAQALGFAALILVVALGARIAVILGWIDDAALGQRVTMVVLGAFFVVTGNALPKRLVPLKPLGCSGAKTQALHRLMGWIQVMWGLTFIVASLLMPQDAAEVVIVSAILAGSVVVVARIIRIRQVSRA